MDHRYSNRHRAIVAQAALITLLAACGGDDDGSGASVSNPPPVTVAPPPPAPPPPPPTPPPPPPTGSTMQQVMLAEHNKARAEVGVPPVTIDPDLNAAALAYANILIANGRFEHSPGSSRPGQGENLWAGTAGFFSFQQMVGGWIDEKKDFVPGIFPNVSRNGGVVGHYTQIIWRNSTKIGCGIASNSQRDVLVCRYNPPGNYVGERVP